jgi:signal transduction histidine kinase/DNA-binding response OmpR family regulator
MGVLKYDYENDLFINFAQGIKNQGDKLNSIITCFLDSEKDLWIGNFKHGLFRIKNTRPDSLEIYTTKDGLPSNDITGILEDQNGKIWLSTAYGLSRFDKKDEFTNYFYNEGLENIQFHQKAALIDKQGTLFFGGNFGVTFFNPGNFGDEKEDVPQIIFESLKVSNNEVKAGDKTKILTQAINKTQKISLNHHYPAFSIEYKGFDYIAANNLKYAYKLEGYDQDWNYVDNRTFAGYSNLNPDDYTFRVKVQNNNGVWSEPAVLKIEIKPAPWKTIWAILGYIILLASVSYLAFRIILRAQLVQKELEIEHNERLRENEVSKMKIKFFTNISHELRTPLTLIKGNVDYLAAELSRMKLDLAPVGSLQNSTDRLLRLVNQLLSFRQLENDTLRLEIKDEDVVLLTKNLVESFKYTSRLKNVSIEIETEYAELTVPLDRDKYDKIVSNLVTNSLKFTEDSGLIIIKIESCEPDQLQDIFQQLPNANNFIKVSVIDDGKGIPLEKIQHIFERFVHYEKTEKKPDYSSSGIGLDFTKRLVEMHQGVIAATSKENIETCFCFAFPMDKNAYPEEVWKTSTITEPAVEIQSTNSPAISSEPSESDENKKTILLAEDDVELNQFICNALKSQFRVISAFNGKEALKLTKSHIPDIIISDIMMPEMDGIELCKALRNNNMISHIPIILLTAKAEVENKITGFTSGADEYVTKPFDLDVLKIRITNLINQRKKLQIYYQNALPIELKEGKINQFEISFMKKLGDVIQLNYTSPDFNVNRLAEEMNMSRTSFYRKFMSIAEMSPKDYLTRFRINKAIKLIKDGEESFGEISYLCGFNSQSIFSVTFKKEKGVTPLMYKKSL